MFHIFIFVNIEDMSTVQTRKRFSEKPIVAFTNSTVFIIRVDFYMAGAP